MSEASDTETAVDSEAEMEHDAEQASPELQVEDAQKVGVLLGYNTNVLTKARL
jgi:hypothetical protein